MGSFKGSSLQIQRVEFKHVHNASGQVWTSDAISAPGECIAFQSHCSVHLQIVGKSCMTGILGGEVKCSA